MIENCTVRQIFDYIEKTYKPLSVIVYGSYSDGSYNENSDFDASSFRKPRTSGTIHLLWTEFGLTCLSIPKNDSGIDWTPQNFSEYQAGIFISTDLATAQG